MDERLIALFEQLSADLAKVAEAVTHSQYALDKVLREVRRNGKIQKEQEKRLDTLQATQRFLAGQQRRRDGAFMRFVENDDHD